MLPKQSITQLAHQILSGPIDNTCLFLSIMDFIHHFLVNFIVHDVLDARGGKATEFSKWNVLNTNKETTNTIESTQRIRGSLNRK